MFGLDEAGRGPVLGSLFVGFVDAADSDLPAGLDDSKNLSRETISELAEVLYADDAITVEVREVTVSEIDAGTENLTELTIARMASLISTCATSDRGVVDACHADASVFGDLVSERLQGDTPPVVDAEHDADTKFEQVMAASIVAKHEREQHVAALQEQHGPVGSGYPSDPATQAFLEEYVETHEALPDCARESWQTSQDILDAAAQTDLTSF